MTDWWRTAVIYQVYPRSFADASGDGMGDLAGITSRLPELADLGVDAVWLSPFYRSPQNDAGYDVADYCDVDPRFGTLADFDAFATRARELGLKVIVDLVPNHSSSEHAWFQAALAAAPGSRERARYIFRDGRGENGEFPPNNWQSVFGGDAWTRVEDPAAPQKAQWYLHLFDTSQPDFDWTNPEVREMFRGVLRFWLDRGVDGFRVDVAHGLVKAAGLPDYEADPGLTSHAAPAPYWAQDGVHEIYRDWHEVLAGYGPDRVLIGEAWVSPLEKLALWVRPDEMQQTFNFGYMETPWSAPAMRKTVDDSLAAFGGVGAPSTWVLSNHDVVRHASRLGLTPQLPITVGMGPRTEPKPDEALGLRRARAATLFMLALPGSAYLYQGEELGLPEVIDLPDAVREDPTFHRTHGESYGRDGCRVPIPWEADAPAYGFSPTGESWLPQPDEWARLAHDRQVGVEGSTLEMYRAALRLRHEHGLGAGELEWVSEPDSEVLVARTSGLVVATNVSDEPAPLPEGEIVLASGPVAGGELPVDTTVWIRA
ncbi:MAG: glycoside hydrolase family 13 protein [Actinomycetales bacterium]|nr:glycoside hydrolase family 13 protein [Actinomycetales bacterium]